MRHFLSRLLLFAGLQAFLFFALVWNPAMPGETSYVAAAIDKHARLQSTPADRIILVGSSSTAFGVHSDLLESSLARPVVNLGLLAGLGIDFLLRQAEAAVRSGDCIVLSFELEMFEGGVNKLQREQMVEILPASFAWLDRREQLACLDRQAFILPGAWSRKSLGIRFAWSASAGFGAEYGRSGFNRWGDYVGHYGTPNRLPSDPVALDAQTFATFTRGAGHLSSVPPGLPDRIAAFCKRCNTKGVTVLYTFVPMMEHHLARQRPSAQRTLALLARIPELRVIDTPEDQVYPLERFYDTASHLDEEGSRERTLRLIPRIRQALLP